MVCLSLHLSLTLFRLNRIMQLSDAIVRAKYTTNKNKFALMNLNGRSGSPMYQCCYIYKLFAIEDSKDHQEPVSVFTFIPIGRHPYTATSLQPSYSILSYVYTVHRPSIMCKQWCILYSSSSDAPSLRR